MFYLFLLTGPSAVNYMLLAFAVNDMRAYRADPLRILDKAEALNRGNVTNERTINDYIVICMH